MDGSGLKPRRMGLRMVMRDWFAERMAAARGQFPLDFVHALLVQRINHERTGF